MHSRKLIGRLGVGMTMVATSLLSGCETPAKVAASVLPASTPAIVADPDRIKAHMDFLAADELLGREPGTPGYDAAADYVAQQFQALGLKAAGEDNSYFQTVRLRSAVRKSSESTLSASSDAGIDLALVDGVDFALGGSLRGESVSASADVVFAGYGIVAPELSRDDYAGLDVRGKIVAVLSRTPGGLQSEERAFYGSRKGREASRRGAIGMISLATPTSEKIYSFERLIKEKRLDSARMGWIGEDDEVYSSAPGLKVGAAISPVGAEKLFAQAPMSWKEVLAVVAEEGGVPPTFDLPVTMTISQASTLNTIESANVLGLIEGSDPLLKNEMLVLSAHLDHLGVTKTDEEDRINNGALDNAAGVATLLEAARLLMAGERPRRSILFFANTAEEKGLLGSQYFAKQPTVAADSLVANINLDMPLLTYDFQDVIVFGGSRSTLRDAIQQATAQMGLTIGEDPFPEQGIFTRSDHFRFVEEGIPSVMLATGMANGGEAAWAEHFEKHYHRPSDDTDNDLDFAAAAKFAELKTRITLTVANAATRPLWRKDDFFARQFDGPQTQ